MQTQVVIVGAGPSGLLLSHLLARQGVDSIVLERRTRDYVEQRVRAGLLEQGTVDLLRQAGVAERLDREGLVHEGFELRFDGNQHRVPFAELTGWTTCMYGQQEVVKDLIQAREAAGGRVYFGVDDVALRDVETDTPSVRCTVQGEPVEIFGDFVAGCDGFHGVCRHSVPSGALVTYEHSYPFAWLGILASVPPSTEELIYAVHERGFALHSMRSPAISRLYLQVGPAEPLDHWPDERIWAELRSRFALDSREVLNDGPILSRGVTEMRSFVVEPMQYQQLFLVGDAAHIVPPSAAKGLNLAVADVRLMAAAFTAWYADGSRELLDGYSRAALAAVWQGQEFSAQMTSLLHPFPGEDGYTAKLRHARLRDLVTSKATATAFSEQYVGLARARLAGGTRASRRAG
ncbi:MAG: 4-hydroxybenzoate 3-monooxygenase [Candidatus Rokuibacteriota bacterium]|nr:MAG: 4-hydroxybenzoate 3-monooxygenase [Candidatus Rokubacteria bacterium]